MQSVKFISNALLGIAFFMGIIVACALLFTLGANVAFTIAPFMYWLTGVLFGVNIIVLLAGLSPQLRTVAGFILYICSYIYGLATWIFGLTITLTLWGWFAVVLGVMMGGVGVVPVGMLAALFKSEWGMLSSLLLGVALTYGARFIGLLLLSQHTENGDTPENGVIDIEPESVKRTWKDIE